MSVYDFKAKNARGEDVPLESYKGKVLVIVNTASKCGFTPQYEGLQKLYEKFRDQGLEILGFPSNDFAEQEPGSNDEVQSFCKVNFGVTFPIFAKTPVRGPEAHPLFVYLTEAQHFAGFDEKHPVAAALNKTLKDSFPDFLAGDSVKWNFTKFLVSRDGKVVGRFEPTADPAAMEGEIAKLL